MLSVIVISKDEPGLEGTLDAVARQARDHPADVEMIVVDASRGRLAGIRQAHPSVRWEDFTPPTGVRISIPHQRNAGIALAQGDVIVFTDAGCEPHEEWLERLTAPILNGSEAVVAGLTVAPEDSSSHYEIEIERIRGSDYLEEAPTINLAFRRDVAVAVGPFDEQFEYGSDIDFTWRIVDHGLRIRSAPDAVVEHGWGGLGRQTRRAYRYGQAKARLYRKHRSRWRQALTRDPVVWIYPLFILGLPLTARVRIYPLLLLAPMWRARASSPLWVVLDHLAYGMGSLDALIRG